MMCQYLNSDCPNNATKLVTCTFIIDNTKTKMNLCSGHAKEQVEQMSRGTTGGADGYTIDSKDL